MGEVFAGRYELIDQIGLHHPHVIVPLGWAGEDDRVLFTMPVVAGGSVATLIGDFGALPPLFVSEVIRQLVDALSAVHAARVVHRDLKPSNILLDPTGTGRPYAYLTDFGIAVDLDGPSAARPRCGPWPSTSSPTTPPRGPRWARSPIGSPRRSWPGLRERRTASRSSARSTRWMPTTRPSRTPWVLMTRQPPTPWSRRVVNWLPSCPRRVVVIPPCSSRAGSRSWRGPSYSCSA